ncbi:hypothetical protein [Paraclostridium tenue]|uniref:Uncharacterized protein n=1 Tax=Paraclostridium tenue TaxID=1737 RepID=A0ABP3XPP0_9FIRM
MRIDIKEIKGELSQLCEDYINILNKMKDDKIINKDLYQKCVLNKIDYLEITKKL